MEQVTHFPFHDPETEWAFAVGPGAFAPYAVFPDIHGNLSNTLEAATEFLSANADAIPWLFGVRQQAYQQAEATMEYRRKQVIDEGVYEDIPLDVDALGTVAKAHTIAEQFGQDSEQHREAYEEFILDCDRKVAEAMRHNSWELFSETTQDHDPVTDKLYTGGLDVDQIYENGLSPYACLEERQRRINDVVRHHTHKALVKEPMLSRGKAAVHTSTCTQWAIDAYKSGVKSAYGGYAPQIQKQMFNYDSFPHGRIKHEQLGVSGLYITDEVVVETFQVLGIIDEGVQLSKTELHNTTGLVSSQKITSVIDVLRIADQIASEKSDKNIFMGEVVEAGHPKDYSKTPEEAATRAQERKELSKELAQYVERLYVEGTDRTLATYMVERYLTEMLLKVAEADPEQAEIIFDKKTADGFREVQSLREQGRYDEAEARRVEVEEAAPPAGSCGPGSCGLEAVDKNTEEGKVLAKKLKAKDGDEIVKDTVRKCKNCGKKSLVYAYNTNKVNTLCTNSDCGAFRSTE